MMEEHDSRLLVAHVMYRFDVGGLENGVVNLINNMPRDIYRHVVISLTEITDFRKRIVRDDVEFIALKKPPGHAIWIYPQLFRLFRTLRPAIVHSRNLAALEVAVPAWAARIPIRVHSEHGREGADLSDSNRKYQFIRRIYRPFVTYYLALSRDLENYLRSHIGVPQNRLIQIYNGVDTQKFFPVARREPVSGSPFLDGNLWIVGTVGRMHAVKDQETLVRAFARALSVTPSLKETARLMIIGDGPLRRKIESLVADLGISEFTWIPGERQDIPEVLRGLDCFVLPSISEGISNTILEAMASGLPVIATDAGGNSELVENRKTGLLVAVQDVEAMASAITACALAPQESKEMGQHGRTEVIRKFSIESMVKSYCSLYASLVAAELPMQSN